MKHIAEVEVFPVLEKNPLDWFDFFLSGSKLSVINNESSHFYWFNESMQLSPGEQGYMGIVLSYHTSK